MFVYVQYMLLVMNPSRVAWVLSSCLLTIETNTVMILYHTLPILIHTVLRSLVTFNSLNCACACAWETHAQPAGRGSSVLTDHPGPCLALPRPASPNPGNSQHAVNLGTPYSTC